MECVDDLGGDAAAGQHVATVATRPIADGRTLLTVDGGPALSRYRRATPATPADPSSRFHPLFQLGTKFVGILAGKVYLIRHTVEPEFHRFVGATLTIEIIDQGDGNFFAISVLTLLTRCIAD